MLCAWSHPGRVRHEAAFASLAGVAPIPASSGLTTRYRLNRCGDRQLNRALHVVALTRLRHDPATQAYAERRRAEGKTDREIKRCLKRYIARQLYRQLETAAPAPPCAPSERPGARKERPDDRPDAERIDRDGADWHRRVVGRSLRTAVERSVDRGNALITAAATVLERANGEDITVQDVADEAGPVAADALPVLREQGRPAPRRVRGPPHPRARHRGRVPRRAGDPGRVRLRRRPLLGRLPPRPVPGPPDLRAGRGLRRPHRAGAADVHGSWPSGRPPPSSTSTASTCWPEAGLPTGFPARRRPARCPSPLDGARSCRNGRSPRTTGPGGPVCGWDSA